MKRGATGTGGQPGVTSTIDTRDPFTSSEGTSPTPQTHNPPEETREEEKPWASPGRRKETASHRKPPHEERPATRRLQR